MDEKLISTARDSAEDSQLGLVHFARRKLDHVYRNGLLRHFNYVRQCYFDISMMSHVFLGYSGNKLVGIHHHGFSISRHIMVENASFHSSHFLKAKLHTSSRTSKSNAIRSPSYDLTHELIHLWPLISDLDDLRTKVKPSDLLIFHPFVTLYV